MRFFKFHDKMDAWNLSDFLQKAAATQTLKIA